VVADHGGQHVVQDHPPSMSPLVRDATRFFDQRSSLAGVRKHHHV
jgi:hypothetical protein